MNHESISNDHAKYTILRNGIFIHPREFASANTPLQLRLQFYGYIYNPLFSHNKNIVRLFVHSTRAGHSRSVNKHDACLANLYAVLLACTLFSYRSHSWNFSGRVMQILMCIIIFWLFRSSRKGMFFYLSHPYSLFKYVQVFKVYRLV